MSLNELSALIGQGIEGEELIQSISSFQSNLENFSREELEDCINLLAEWISKHSASKKLENVLGLCVEIYASQGFSEDFLFPLNDEDENFPCNNFVSCVLSLINSILKSNQAEKYIRLLFKLLQLSSFIVHQKTVSESFRRKGSLKLILGFFKNLVKAGAKSEHSIKVLILICNIFCKIGYSSNKCRDYIVRKSGVQIICAILSPTGNYQQEQKLIYSSLYALGTLAGNNDQQLLVWVSGGVSAALAHFEKQELIEPAAFTIWRTCIEAIEVQEILFASNFHEKALKILETGPNPEITTFLIGILRRLSNNANYKDQLAEPISKSFLFWLKDLTKKSYMVPLKELAAGLGSLCTKLEVAREVVKATGIEIIIEVVLRHPDQAKLVKTCVGALVNLSVQGKPYLDGIVDRITSNLKFYELVDLLLQTYNKSNFMMEYTLKLILNGLQNSNCLYHLSDKKFLLLILVVFNQTQQEEDLFLLCVCIFRSVVSHSKFYIEKGLEVFNEAMQPEIIETLLNGFQRNLGNIKVLTEVILLLSSISQQEGKFLDYLRDNKFLSENIKVCLEFHAADKDRTAILTECMANLPVEEFNMIL